MSTYMWVDLKWEGRHVYITGSVCTWPNSLVYIRLYIHVAKHVLVNLQLLLS